MEHGEKRPVPRKVCQILLIAGVYAIGFGGILIFYRLLWALMLSGNDFFKGRYEILSLDQIHIPYAILLFFMCCSLSDSLVYLNPVQKKRYLKANSRKDPWSVGKRASYALTEPAFWIEFGIIVVWILILPARPLFSSFLDSIGIESQEKWLMLSTLPIFFLALLISHCTALGKWTFEKKPYDHRNWKFTLTVLKNIGIKNLAYIAIAYALPLFLGTLQTFWRVLVAVITDVWAFVLIILIILFLCSFRLLRGIHKRRVFLKKLKTLCREMGIRLKTSKVFRSLLFSHPGPNIWIETERKRYEIKLLAALNRSSPIYLTGSGEAQSVRRVLLVKEELMRYTTSTQFSWESDCEKILIVLPVSRHLYAIAEQDEPLPFPSDESKSYQRIPRSGLVTMPRNATAIEAAEKRMLDVGDKVADYTIYSGTAFLNGLEQDVLEKKPWE